MTSKKKMRSGQAARRNDEAKVYAQRVALMREGALRGDRDAHAWLGREQLPRAQRPSYALKANAAQALGHIRIAARKGHRSALHWLGTQGDVRPLERAVPENGTMPHPHTNRDYVLTRSAWFDGASQPTLDGVYERKLGNDVVYAIWNRSSWTEHRSEPECLTDEFTVGTLRTARGKRLPWRGLADDPDPPYISYAEPAGKFAGDAAIGGYVAHKEPMSPLVKMVHIAKIIKSKDGDFLTMCGYHAKRGETLQLWNAGVKIKVTGGLQPHICEACVATASDAGPENVPHVDAIIHANDSDGPAAAVDGTTSAGQISKTEVSPGEQSTATQRQPLSYSGGIGYDNYPTGSRAEVFEFIDQEHIKLTLRSTVSTPGIPDSWLVGIASKRWNGLFDTDWITLTTADGHAHPDGQARFEFAISHHDTEYIKIEGAWVNLEDGWRFPFIANLRS